MSNNYSYTETKYPVNYEIVKGLPETVESKVKELLKEGWVLGSEMHVLRTSSNVDIVVQSMIYFE